jgi:hypothetical protein
LNCSGLVTADPMAVPASTTAADETPTIRGRRIAPVTRWERMGQVRAQRDGQTLARLKEGTCELNLSRQPGVVMTVVDNGARSMRARRGQVDQMESVILTEPNIRDQEVIRCESEAWPRGLKPRLAVDVAEPRGHCGQSRAHVVMRFDNKSVTRHCRQF